MSIDSVGVSHLIVEGAHEDDAVMCIASPILSLV
jgi:hypothetical protein